MTSQNSVGSNPVSVAAVNLDGDAFPDLVVSNRSSNSISILHNDSPGSTRRDWNGNGFLDECDLRDHTSTDLNANGIPDEAEPDCNGNQVPDSFEIAASANLDENQNGIPDDCEDCNGNGRRDDLDIAADPSQDCNGNGVPDSCDLAKGWFSKIDCAEGCVFLDCNRNGLSDANDIVSGRSKDFNANGIPDECEGGLRLPGDANEDGGVDQSDAVWLLEHLFLGTRPNLPCEGNTAAAPGPGELALLDFNDGGEIDISDAVALLTWKFLGGLGHPLGTACSRIAGCLEVCAP
ncbi:MAG: hypothetical protein HY717_13740 [Planctomycetes bacterium]|nr:hypothetical protein [Planctomycetota bacterium]